MELFDAIDPHAVYLVKAVLATAAIGVGWLLFVARRYALPSVRRASVAVLALLAPLSLLAYHNLGKLHWGDSINVYDTYHYYMGAKYFHELGYWHLYQATVVAADELGARPIARVREVRHQKTYQRVSRAAAARSQAEWRDRFTAERWQEFKDDLSFFASRASPNQWRNMLVDKGYNPTPVWTALGLPLANAVPARQGPGIVALFHLDLVAILAIVAAMWWAFGLETALLCAVFLGVNVADAYGPVGGAFLRWDYCAWAVLALAALKRGHPFLSGVFLSYATLLRISPLTLAAGVAVITTWELVQAMRSWRRSDGGSYRTLVADLGQRPRFTTGMRFAAGGAAGAVVLVLLSVVVVPGGWDSWHEWYDKMQLHRDSLGTKRYGLEYVFAYQGETTRTDLHLGTGGWPGYHERKKERLADLAPARALVKIAFCLAFVLAVLRRRQWEAMALGTMFVFVLLSPTRYYYAQLVVLIPLLVHGWRNAGRLMGYSLLMGTMVVAWFFRTFHDLTVVVQFVVSLCLLVVYVYLLAWFIHERGDETGAGTGFRLKVEG